MVFRKRGGLRKNESWTYDDIFIEIVNDFTYLGVNFNYTGSFSLNQKVLADKGLKALNVLNIKIRSFVFETSTIFQLCDAFVSSILGYLIEIWVYTKSKELERIHLTFCKRILNVKTSTCNAAVYCELGSYPSFTVYWKQHHEHIASHYSIN